ncbi:MAG TPA: SDR family NAD(P)-dependent oxidoreductase, partial [Mycobacteriales bacterium]|nr:SDR family NAD(P)-dependent oxidoreductase [Mycobacteriales bacterium]
AVAEQCGVMPTALITGASRGLGRALADSLAGERWRLVLDARTAADLDAVAAHLIARGTDVVAVAGDVTDPGHRRDLAAAVGDRLDLLVLNASCLGTSPLPPLGGYDLDALRRVLETNTVAPLALTQLVLSGLRAAAGTVLAISSDAAVAAYPGWGGYGASKAALDQLANVLGAEEPGLRVYAVDPGDMRTRMHAEAFPGEDISDRPEPETVVPALRRLLAADLPSGRYIAAELAGPADSELPRPADAGPATPASVQPAGPTEVERTGPVGAGPAARATAEPAGPTEVERAGPAEARPAGATA